MTDVELLNAAIQLGARPRPPVGSVVRLVNVKPFDVMTGHVYSQVVVGSLNPDQPSLFGQQPIPTTTGGPAWTGRYYWDCAVHEFIALPDGVSALDVLAAEPWTGTWRSRARVVG